MGLPTGPVTLAAEQVSELNSKLSALRHDLNNHLAMLVAAAELIKINPSALDRYATTLVERPAKITEEIKKFSEFFEKTLGITRP